MRGVLLLHKVADFAIFAVLAIATTTLFSTVIVGTGSTGVEAFAPTAIAIQRLPLPTTTTKTTTPTPLVSLGMAADTSTSDVSTTIPRLGPSDLETLRSQGYVIVENFLPAGSDWNDALRTDVLQLRDNNKFKIAKIGQDSTNALNQDIRIAETCFVGRNKAELRDVPSATRERLYDVLETLRRDLEGGDGGSSSKQPKLDAGLSEFLYAYYPKGGFYRRHRDAIKGSASWLREYSLLLYLNDDSYDAETDGGRLRIHMDTGGDFLPAGEAPLFQDVDADGGTLVLFESDKFPHEVLDTERERFAVVGWYNRPVSLGDLAAINDANANAGGGGASDPLQLAGLAAAAGLVTVGLINLLAASS